MRIVGLLKRINEVFTVIRRAGHTSILKEIAETKDVYILVPNEDTKLYVGKSAITFEDVERGYLLGKPSKPILIDNSTMIKLTEDALAEFKRLENVIKRKDKTLNKMKELIEELRKEEENE